MPLAASPGMPVPAEADPPMPNNSMCSWHATPHLPHLTLTPSEQVKATCKPSRFPVSATCTFKITLLETLQPLSLSLCTAPHHCTQTLLSICTLSHHCTQTLQQQQQTTTSHPTHLWGCRRPSRCPYAQPLPQTPHQQQQTTAPHPTYLSITLLHTLQALSLSTGTASHHDTQTLQQQQQPLPHTGGGPPPWSLSGKTAP